MKSLKNKTTFNYFNNNIHKKGQNNNHSKAKSFKVIRPATINFKIQFINKKMHSFLKKNNITHNRAKIKNDKKGAKNLISTINDESKKNTNGINDILNELLKIIQKINEINIIKNKKIKSFNRHCKSYKKNIGNIDKSEGPKDEFLKSIDKPKKFKCRFKLLNNNSINLENANKDENIIQINKTEINFKNLNSKNKKNEISKNRDSPLKINQKIKLKLLSLDEKDKEKKSELNSSKKRISKSIDKMNISNYYNSMMSEKTEEVNYIDKIRDKDFMNLYNKFKKSMKKNKKEEICHRKSLVFPPETVNYIIRMKNELIIDKYRYEYLKIFDNYKYNKQKILKVIKKCNKSEIKNMETSGINISKINSRLISTQKNDNIKKNDKSNNNDINNYDDDKFHFIFSDKDYFEIY